MVNKFKAGRNLTHVFDEQMDNETEREPFKAAYNTEESSQLTHRVALLNSAKLHPLL